MDIYLASLSVGILVLTGIIAIKVYINIMKTRHVRKLYEAGLKRYKMLIKLDEHKLHKKKK